MPKKHNIKNLIDNLYNRIQKFLLKTNLKKKYIRNGKYIKCEKCCENIYIKHQRKVLKEKQDFEKLQKQGEYLEFEIVSCDEIGLVFKCKNLDNKTRLCKNHKKRSIICRKYPQEEIFSMGSNLASGCGYWFEPIEHFEDVLKKILKKNNH